MVCPYSFAVAGGVQVHVRELAAELIDLGHEVSVIAPAGSGPDFPSFVVDGGGSVAVRYNGSVARLSFLPSNVIRVRRWLRHNNFDVVHLHEPNAPSLTMLAMIMAHVPIVATYHTATERSRLLNTFAGALQPFFEKVNGRIAVSALARRWQMESLGSDAVEIPNGVHVDVFASAPVLPGYPRRGGTLAFVGRYDEPRKGMGVLLAALPSLIARHPDLEVLVVGRGDAAQLRRAAGDKVFSHLRLLGQVSDAEKASVLRSADVYCAPNTGGESFGIVLVEALAAGTAVAASDLEAFRRVLADGTAGELVATGTPRAWADTLDGLLSDEARRTELVRAGREAVRAYDWPVIAGQVLRVYETVTVAGRRVQEAHR